MTAPINSNNSSSEYTGPSNNDYACAHNGRPETTMRDVLEHCGNGEFGSAAAEAIDIATRDNDNKSGGPTPDNKA